MIYPVSKMIQHQEFLEANGIPYTYESTNRTFKFKSVLGTSVFTNNTLPPAELWFIKKVKDHVNKNIKQISKLCKPIKEEEIKFINVSRVYKYKMYRNAVEIDVNNAYWEAAYRLGFIDEEIYLTGLGKKTRLVQDSKKGKIEVPIVISKKTRLASLGSLAKKIEVYKFNGRSMRHTDTVENVATRLIWANVCYEISELIRCAKNKIAKEDYISYWVDAIFCKQEGQEGICDYLKAHDYKFKIKPLKYIYKSKDFLKIVEKDRERKFPI